MTYWVYPRSPPLRLAPEEPAKVAYLSRGAVGSIAGCPVRLKAPTSLGVRFSATHTPKSHACCETEQSTECSALTAPLVKPVCRLLQRV